MGTIFRNNFDVKEGEIRSGDQDLLLAAEIGQVLLERNKELEVLLKNSQEYGDEQAEQASFYCNQVEILREAKELISQAYDQLESSNQLLSEKHDQTKAENKSLLGKNERLWEHIRILEKKNQDLTVELKNVNSELESIKFDLEENLAKDKKPAPLTREISGDFVEIEEQASILHQHTEEQEMLKAQINQLHRDNSELKVQASLKKLQKEEITMQLEDATVENCALQKRISSLNQEVREWEAFAQKEENYRRLADAFTARHAVHEESPFSPNRTRSCESLSMKKEDNLKLMRTPTSNLFSAVNSSSFLSELDGEYADLVKKYEALLEKCHKEGKFTENPERTRKVQRAIQTLSFDFSSSAGSSKKTTPLSPKKSLVSTPSKEAATGISHQAHQAHYKQMFSDIFSKLKEREDFKV